MLKVTFETKIYMENGISEIKKVEYDLPETIVYKGQYMYYNRQHKAYVSTYGSRILYATDYIEETLKNNKQNVVEENEERCL